MWPFWLWGFDSPFSHPLSIFHRNGPPLTLILLGMSVMGGCASAPGEEVTEAFQAASSGDFDRFCAHFTADSCAVLRGLQTVENEGVAPFALPTAGPAPEIVQVEQRPGAGFRRTEAGTLQRTDLAIVYVELGDDVVPFPLIEDRGRWRIDLFTLKTQWSMLGRLGAMPDSRPPPLN